MLATTKPIAIVSPMKKLRKTKKRRSSITKFVNVKGQRFEADRESTVCDESTTTPSPRKNKKYDEKLQLIPYARKRSLPKCIKRLCAKVDNLDLSTNSNHFDNYESIPEHDRKILSRMAAKMQREISNAEIAHRAHIVWENEKQLRDQLHREQEEEYKVYLRGKREMEKEFNKKKSMENREIFDWEREHLTNRINEKDQATENRLKILNYRKMNNIHEKHEMTQEKFEHVMVSMREKKIEEILWRKALADSSKQKNAKAEINRELLLRLSKQRTAIDNKIHSEIQKQNWIDQKTMEMQQLLQLKQLVNEKNNKMDCLKTKKENYIRKSRQLADSTARMREDLKRSLSPDVFQKGVSPWLTPTCGKNYQVCLTPNSYESHIRLG